MQVIIKYAKHPPKMANQEFHKTTFQDFRPSFAKTIKTRFGHFFPKHPPKMANQEFHKTTFQDFRPSLRKL